MNSVVKAPLSEHGGAVAPFVGYVQFVSFSQFANTLHPSLGAHTQLPARARDRLRERGNLL